MKYATLLLLVVSSPAFAGTSCLYHFGLKRYSASLSLGSTVYSCGYSPFKSGRGIEGGGTVWIYDCRAAGFGAEKSGELRVVPNEGANTFEAKLVLRGEVHGQNQFVCEYDGQ